MGLPSYTVLNSGVMFHAQDPRTMPKEQDWPISVEMQFLAGLGDGLPRPTGNMCSPGTEIVYEGKQYNGHCLNSNSKTYGKDEWVKAELIVWGDLAGAAHHQRGYSVAIQQTVNGRRCCQPVQPCCLAAGKPLTEGYIALQSEGQPISFRNLFLKELK